MTDEQVFKNILQNKSAIMNVLWYSLKDTEENSWDKTPQGTRQRSGDKIPTYELMAFSEALLFELGAFLDIMIKCMCGRELSEQLHFNWTTLSQAQPRDKFVDLLIICYNDGLSNNPSFSLRKMKEYRNVITHATILDISKHMMWRSGDGLPRLENSFYMLPDNPEEIGAFRYDQKIALFGFFEEMVKIFDTIVTELNAGSVYNKYRIVPLPKSP